jgi:competence protein ComEC
LPDGFSLSLLVERLRFGEAEHEGEGRVRLFAPVKTRETLRRFELLELQSGARVRILTSLRRAESFRNPAVLSTIELLDRNGIDATGTIKSPLLVERLDDEPVFLPLWWLSRYRAQLLARMHELFEPHTAGLLGAMLLGYDGFLTREVGERFRIGGTYHILVISGMHITIVGFLALFVVRRFTARPILQFVVPVVAMWLYVLAVGAEVSVVRAGVMFTIIVLAPS